MRRRSRPPLLFVLSVAACGAKSEEADVESSSTVQPVTASSGRSSPRSFTATPVTPSVPPGLTAPGFSLDPRCRSCRRGRRLGVQARRRRGHRGRRRRARRHLGRQQHSGCPQPRMQYLQRTVDGVLVILEAEGRRYEYHGGAPLFLCENPKAPSGQGLTARDLRCATRRSRAVASRPSGLAVPAGWSRRCGPPSCRGRRRGLHGAGDPADARAQALGEHRVGDGVAGTNSVLVTRRSAVGKTATMSPWPRTFSAPTRKSCPAGSVCGRRRRR